MINKNYFLEAILISVLTLLTTSSHSSVIDKIVDSVSNKRIVQLGESGHGMAQTYQLKLAIVKKLHQQHGFNVLALEGGQAECYSAKSFLDRGDAVNAMFACFWDTWASEDALALFEYIRSTTNSANPLKIIGFDNMPTGKAFVQTLVQEVPQLPQLEIVENAFQTIYSGRFSSTEELIELQQLAIDGFTNALRLNQNKELKIILQGRLDSLNFKAQDFSRTLMESLREKLMAKNLIEYSTNNVDQKIMVWAHNAHIAYAQSKFIEGPKRQGEYVHQRLEKELYTIGIYPYKGLGYVWFLKENKQISAHQKHSLESEMAALDGDIVFVDKLKDNFSWWQQKIPSYEWGINENVIVPADMYDGLILIREVSPITRIMKP